MNIQDKIRSHLGGLRGVPTSDFNSHTFNSPRNEAEKLYESLNVSIPIKQCEFVGIVTFDDTSLNTEYMLLTKLNKADSGISFTQSSDMAYSPIPTMTVGTVSIESFIPRNWRGQIANLYYRQFNGGMLGCCYERPTFTIAWMELDEDRVTENTETLFNTFKQNIATLKNKMNNSFANNMLNNALSDAVGRFEEPSTSVLDEMKLYDDNLVEDNVSTYAEERLDTEVLHPIVHYKRCNFSLPKFTIEPSSNDFVKMSMDITYKDMITEIVNN